MMEGDKMTTVISLVVGFALGFFATIIVMVLLADRNDDENQ